jgi:heat shock protein HtpX
MQLLLLVTVHSLLGYTIAWSLDLGTFLRFGLPLLFLVGNMVLAPLLMEKAFRINWAPPESPLANEVCQFLLEIFQMHGKAPPGEFAGLLGVQASLPIPIGLVDEEAPHIMLAKAPGGGAGLVISSGFARILNQEEQKAALAHEVYYLLKTERTLFTNAVMLLPTVLFSAYRFVTPDPEGNWVQRNIAQVLYSAYRLSVAVSAWTVRSRVLKADAFSVEMTGNPNALASAILVLSYGLAHRGQDLGGMQQASSPYEFADMERSRQLAQEAAANGDFTPEGLVKALRWERCNMAARFFELFSNHPLPSRRLVMLEKKAQERGHEFTFPLEQGPMGMRLLGLSLELLTRAAPWLGAYLGYLYCGAYDWPSNIPYFLVFGFTLGLVLSAVLWYRPFHAYRNTTTRELMLDLDVSDSNPRCAQIEGRIAGRHRPGYAFGADLLFEDELGSLMLQYRQPVPMLDSVFAFFAADDLKGKRVQIEGWFRRNPEPFLEIRRLTVLEDGRVFGCYKFLWQWMLIAFFSGLTYWIGGNF